MSKFPPPRELLALLQNPAKTSFIGGMQGLFRSLCAIPARYNTYKPACVEKKLKTGTIFGFTYGKKRTHFFPRLRRKVRHRKSAAAILVAHVNACGACCGHACCGHACCGHACCGHACCGNRDLCKVVEPAQKVVPDCDPCSNAF